MKNIWREEDEYFKLAPLTEKDVKIAEHKLNVKLPDIYINILKEQNGGNINLNSFPTTTPTSWDDNHINVDHFWGIGEVNGILETDYLINEWGLPKDIVLISGSGHSWVALDYRGKKEEPTVIFLDTDDDQIIELAPNFDTFLNGLYVEEIVNVEIVENEDFDFFTKKWTVEEINTALTSNNVIEVGYALDYFSLNPTEYIHLIGNSLVKLLQNENLEIRQIAANYSNHFNETGILSNRWIDEIVSCIRNDKEIDYYVEMYFPDK